jgi:hypothetical protein
MGVDILYMLPIGHQISLKTDFDIKTHNEIFGQLLTFSPATNGSRASALAAAVFEIKTPQPSLNLNPKANQISFYSFRYLTRKRWQII